MPINLLAWHHRPGRRGSLPPVMFLLVFLLVYGMFLLVYSMSDQVLVTSQSIRIARLRPSFFYRTLTDCVSQQSRKLFYPVLWRF